MTLMGRELFKILLKRYQSEIRNNHILLINKFKEADKIGKYLDIPKHLNEMDNQLLKIAEATNKLEILTKYFTKGYQ